MGIPVSTAAQPVPIHFVVFCSMSEFHYSCVNTIDCAVTNSTPTDFLLALGSADAEKYVCSEEIRPSKWAAGSILRLHLHFAT